MKNLKLKSLVYKEGKRWNAQCLEVEIASHGATKKSALSNLNEALELYFEDVKPTTKQSITQPDIVTLNIQYA